MGRFRSITHPFAARQHVLLHLLPLDLHVLGTPPAFNLSQDQTLHLKILRSTKKEWIQNGPTTCWTFWSLGLHAQRHRRESPHKLPAKLLKNTRTRQGPRRGAVHASRVAGERGRKYSHRLHSVNFRFFRDFPSRNREPVRPDEGAQYSPHRWVVNEVAGKNFSRGLQSR